MEFNSQICTTKEQSERLLALGLKKETADIVIMPDNTLIVINENSFIYHNLENAIQEGYSPAWSLHRLIDLCPHYRVEVGISYVSWDYRNEFPKDFTKHKDTYNNLIDCIEWLIKVGYFNKEYLEE